MRCRARRERMTTASALAVLLELARAFSTTPARRPIRLIAFDLEESDRAGSRAYAEDIRRRGESLALMISLEMLGACLSSRWHFRSESDSVLLHEQAFPPLEDRPGAASAAERAGLRAEGPSVAFHRGAGPGEPGPG